MQLRRLRLRGTVRMRFTVLYAGLFLVSGAVLLAIAAFVASGSRVAEAAPGAVPELPVAGPAQARIHRLEQQLTEADATQARQVLRGSAVALGVMAVVSVGLGRLVAGRVLLPLRTMTSATRRISADNLHSRLGVTGPGDEVKDLADTIDGLLERLEGSFEAQRRFVANASHELRTPLATMRATLDVTVAKPGPVPAQTIALAGRLRTELDRVDGLLEAFLVLARTQYGGFTDSGRVGLDGLVAESLAVRADEIAAGDLTAEHEDGTGGPAYVWGSASLLRRVVDNLLDNAVRHNRNGGRLRVGAHVEGQWVRLVVESDGPVLDPGQTARLGRPFSRLSPDRTGGGQGSGLGLSIVAAVADAHHGGLELLPRPEGGLRAVVTLPRSAGSEA
ncbi:ATP-binding protein [Streptomyces sp. NPDC051366]|uniref:HAMP domain-containing sensor histidine kinase n=1 Tax=Streptomyces sp. NPDC051366 TaxID=3365652 RepID=UPI0037A974EE